MEFFVRMVPISLLSTVRENEIVRVRRYFAVVSSFGYYLWLFVLCFFFSSPLFAESENVSIYFAAGQSWTKLVSCFH